MNQPHGRGAANLRASHGDRSRAARAIAALALAAAFAGGGTAWAADATKAGAARAGTGESRAEINKRYQQELAACKNGSTQQEKSACLHEARASHAEALRGSLPDAAAVSPDNATRRCEALQGADRVACRERMQGKGTVSGSVGGGGIYRELRTVESVPAGTVPAPEPAASQPR